MDTINRIKNRIELEHKVLRIKSLKKRFKPEDQILIFSDPRGGSTWLAEMINTIPNSAILWEPLHLKYMTDFKKLGFSWRQFIPEKEEWNEAKKAFDKVLSGKVLNEWTLLKTDIETYKEADKLIVKICRGNALLPWIVNQYNFKYKPIYLIRNPFAVVSSQLKQGGWDYKFSNYKAPQGRFSKIFSDNKNLLEKLSSKEELLIANWCITNKVALESNSRFKYQVVYYEDFVDDPVKCIQKIFNNWRITVPENIYKSVSKKSSTTKRKDHNVSKDEYLNSWKNSFSLLQIQKCTDLIKKFEIQDEYINRYLD